MRISDWSSDVCSSDLVEYGNVTVEIQRAEAILRRDRLLPRETFRQGDRIRAYIEDVRSAPRGPQIFLSRTHPDFIRQLFRQEAPEARGKAAGRGRVCQNVSIRGVTVYLKKNKQ